MTVIIYARAIMAKKSKNEGIEMSEEEVVAEEVVAEEIIDETVPEGTIDDNPLFTPEELEMQAELDAIRKRQEEIQAKLASRYEPIKKRIAEIEAELTKLRALLPQSERRRGGGSDGPRPRTGVGKWMQEQIIAGLSNEEILAEANKLFPDNKNSNATIAYYRNVVKNGGRRPAAKKDEVENTDTDDKISGIDDETFDD